MMGRSNLLSVQDLAKTREWFGSELISLELHHTQGKSIPKSNYRMVCLSNMCILNWLFKVITLPAEQKLSDDWPQILNCWIAMTLITKSPLSYRRWLMKCHLERTLGSFCPSCHKHFHRIAKNRTCKQLYDVGCESVCTLWSSMSLWREIKYYFEKMNKLKPIWH